MDLMINIVGSALILIIGAIVLYVRDKRGDPRGRQIAAVADSFGMNYRGCDAWTESSAFLHLPIFRQGWDHMTLNTCSNVLTVHGRPHPLRMGDFEYTVGEGDNERSRQFSYLLVQLPFAGVPDLLIRPEGVLDRLTETVNTDALDIDFESAEFSRRFHVQCDSKRFAYDLINPGLMECLLAAMPSRVEIARGFMAVGDGSSMWTPEQFRGHYRMAKRFLECWPPHLADLLERGRWLEA